jgi:hypothetical protein
MSCVTLAVPQELLSAYLWHALGLERIYAGGRRGLDDAVRKNSHAEMKQRRLAATRSKCVERFLPRRRFLRGEVCRAMASRRFHRLERKFPQKGREAMTVTRKPDS